MNQKIIFGLSIVTLTAITIGCIGRNHTMAKTYSALTISPVAALNAF